MTTFWKKFAPYAIYIDEIRRRIYRIAIVFLFFFAVGFLCTIPFFRVFKTLMEFDGVLMVATSPFQFLDLSMNTGLFFALIFTLPYIAFQIFSFLKTGLNKREKRRFFATIPGTIILFASGFAYGFFTMHSTFGAIADINTSLGIKNYWDIGQFLEQIFITSTFLGLTFEFPIVLSFLVKLGLLSAPQLRGKRRHAVLTIFIFVTLLPPTDGVSLLIMVLPLLVLYEITILMNANKAIQETN
jgi:sec-independent protein translocase protein TatC